MNAPSPALKPAAKPPRPDLDAELNNLAMSKDAQPLFDAVMKHIEENVAPIIKEIQGSGIASRRAIARVLKARGVATARGGQWTAVQVGAVLCRA